MKAMVVVFTMVFVTLGVIGLTCDQRDIRYCEKHPQPVNLMQKVDPYGQDFTNSTVRLAVWKINQQLPIK